MILALEKLSSSTIELNCKLTEAIVIKIGLLRLIASTGGTVWKGAAHSKRARSCSASHSGRYNGRLKIADLGP